MGINADGSVALVQAENLPDAYQTTAVCTNVERNCEGGEKLSASAKEKNFKVATLAAHGLRYATTQEESGSVMAVSDNYAPVSSNAEIVSAASWHRDTSFPRELASKLRV